MFVSCVNQTHWLFYVPLVCDVLCGTEGLTVRFSQWAKVKQYYIDVTKQMMMKIIHDVHRRV